MTKMKINNKLYHSQESIFKAATCLEDLHHIEEILNTNVENTSPDDLTEILYKSVTRPAQVNTLNLTKVMISTYV